MLGDVPLALECSALSPFVVLDSAAIGTWRYRRASLSFEILAFSRSLQMTLEWIELGFNASEWLRRALNNSFITARELSHRY